MKPWRIELAPRVKTEKYQTEINQLLAWVGEDALTTDESTVSDFPPGADKLLEKKLGYPVKESDYLVDIAAKMRKNNKWI